MQRLIGPRLVRPGLVGAGLALVLLAAPAVAQTMAPAPPAAAGGSASGGVAGGSAGAVTPQAPKSADVVSASADTVGGHALLKGANSFTEGQARGRLEHHGYNQVSRLTEGKDGIWRGTAAKSGAMVHVGVDFKGDIAIN